MWGLCQSFARFGRSLFLGVPDLSVCQSLQKNFAWKSPENGPCGAAVVKMVHVSLL
jgi:hypothetical protein